VVDLQPGATPVDFAYRVHTEIGHRCRGAKVNGRIVPLTYKVKTGEQIEILTSRDARPSRDWLNGEYGYVRTSRARAKVAGWFRSQAREQNIDDGKALLAPELNRLGMGKVNLEQICKDMGLNEVDDLYAGIGSGTVRMGQVVHHAQRQVEPVGKQDDQLSLLPAGQHHHHEHVSGKDDIYIKGVGKLLSSLANCCHPVPGEEIVGFITQGRGISIHKADCTNLINLKEHHPKRIIDVTWGDAPQQQYPVELALKAYDRRGLLKDITMLLANEDANVLAMNTLSHQQDGTVDMMVTVEIDDLERLGQLMNKLDQLPNIVEVKRYRG